MAHYVIQELDSGKTVLYTESFSFAEQFLRCRYRSRFCDVALIDMNTNKILKKRTSRKKGRLQK